ncbi:MAG: hypothetical protein KME57_22090 [Scytonema hyalinum WJT4-NPBG1]|uniref:hypothetical protein n=1 Tax=Scytonema sp. PCC 10023 TaxID=1680591 RepID=UPI0039C67A3B|nr:hypothetical protein [Scytonema hyalinum WJT4-NPBG1]
MHKRLKVHDKTPFPRFNYRGFLQIVVKVNVFVKVDPTFGVVVKVYVKVNDDVVVKVKVLGNERSD